MKHRYLVLFLAASAAFAQPKIQNVLNGASFIPAGLPGSAIARGSVFVIAGTGLGPEEAVKSEYPLGASLAGSSITVTAGGSDISAFLVSASATRLTAVLPSSTPAGPATVKVTVGDATSEAASFNVSEVGPGIFTQNGLGIGPAVLRDADGNPVNRANSTHSGDTVSLSVTGLGPIQTPDNELPPMTELSTDVELFVANKTAPIKSKARSTTDAGVDVISFEVPAGVSGCAVSLAIRAGGNIGNFATIAVADPGKKVCSDPAGYTEQELSAIPEGGLRVGAITLARLHIKATVAGLGSAEIKTDNASAGFEKFEPQNFLGGTGALLASYGSCVVITSTSTDVSRIATDPVKGTVLDAGPSLTLTGPGGTRTIAKRESGYFVDLGTVTQLPVPLPVPIPGVGGTPYLEPGSYTVTGPGGADVKAFTARLTLPRPITWTNQDAITNIPRANDLTVNWSGGGSSDFVLIAGASARERLSAQFVCTSPSSAGTFTIPSVVLSALPPSDTPAGPTAATGSLALIQSPLSDLTRFTAEGLDIGVITYTTAIGKNVSYR